MNREQEYNTIINKSCSIITWPIFIASFTRALSSLYCFWGESNKNVKFNKLKKQQQKMCIVIRRDNQVNYTCLSSSSKISSHKSFGVEPEVFSATNVYCFVCFTYIIQYDFLIINWSTQDNQISGTNNDLQR